MYHRQSLRSSLVYAVLTALVLVVGGYSATVSAASAPTAAFSYENSRSTAVDIALATTAGTPALLTFYSQGTNGLRLLENGFTDDQGNYAGNLRLPAHLTQIVVVVRSADRDDTLTLTINNDAISYVE